MRIETDLKLDYGDVLIRPKRSTLKSRQEVDLDRDYGFRHARPGWRGVPIIAANMDTIGTLEMFRALAELNLATAIHKHYPVDRLAGFFERLEEPRRHLAFYSLGIAEADLAKLQVVQQRLGRDRSPIAYCIDVANGYSEQFADFVARFREREPEAILMAGNVVTGEMVEELVLNGADIVKVGIGPGSVCTTRKMTGVGYPQLSAVIECADAAHGLKGMVCADGGCTVPGDLAKAFGAGADFVMLGGMLAGHDESGGTVTYRDLTEAERRLIAQRGVEDPEVAERLKHKDKVIEFYGMSSETAMRRHAGGVAEYRAAEGKTVQVGYRGPVRDTAQEILGGLRSACTYVGAVKLKELSKRTTFVRTNTQRNLVFGAE